MAAYVSSAFLRMMRNSDSFSAGGFATRMEQAEAYGLRFRVTG